MRGVDSVAMTEEEEKKELRRAQSAFRTAKTYVNRYGEPEGLRELQALIEEKLSDAPIRQEEPTEEERQLQSVRQELAALRDAQQLTTEQVLDVKEEVLKVHRTQNNQAKQLEDAALGPGISVGAIVVTVIIAIFFFIKSFF
jgi:hypothetical protein